MAVTADRLEDWVAAEIDWLDMLYSTIELVLNGGIGGRPETLRGLARILLYP